MLNNKDVIIFTLVFLMQDVTTFYLTGFDLGSGLESIFIEAAETCLALGFVQKLILYWCSQRKKIFNTVKDGLVFIVGTLKKILYSTAVYMPRDEKYSRRPHVIWNCCLESFSWSRAQHSTFLHINNFRHLTTVPASFISLT